MVEYIGILFLLVGFSLVNLWFIDIIAKEDYLGHGSKGTETEKDTQKIKGTVDDMW